MKPDLSDDDILLAALGEALAAARHPRLSEIITQGKETFAFAPVSAEFAALVYDSLLADEPVGASRAADDVRTVIFETERGLSVEVEIGTDGILGQVAPAGPARVVAEFADGSRTTVDTDGLGCFTLAYPGRGSVRFHITRDNETTLTDWA